MAWHLMWSLLRASAGVVTLPLFDVEYLVVAGGGAGGQYGDLGSGGGGGGAGGLLSGTTSLPRSAGVTVTVGDGGVGSQADGSASVFGNITTVGGGGGGAAGNNGRSGGSGGGGGGTTSGTTSGGSGTTGQGFDGSGGSTSNSGSGGGSGGFGISGGGDGTTSSIAGAAVVYARGGGGDAGSTEPAANTGSGGRGGLRSSAEATGIVVSGAGTSAVNGTYTISGTSLFDSPEYRLGSTNYYIRNQGYWVIINDDNPFDVLYQLNQTEVDEAFYYPFVGPYPEGPATVINGSEPAPTIADESLQFTFFNGADGVVVLAYPDSLPALTVGEGLTYNQPTRAGYRVYRFTAGTGTVTLP